MKRSYFVVILVFVIFFAISFLTNIMGTLIPEIKTDYNLSLFMAGFLPFSFFLAYGVMSIPAGSLIERFKEKPIIIAAWALAMAGCILFVAFPSYTMILACSFMIGIGMAMLQVAINPLLRVAGGEEHFAFNSVLAQLIFGLASFISPSVYSYLVTNLDNTNGGRNVLMEALSKIIPQGLPWISLYVLFAVIALIMVLIGAAVKLPKVELKDDEKAGAVATYLELFKNKYVILFFLGIFCYVGVEQGVSNWISKFLETYHQIDPETVGASVFGNYWLFLTIGCLISLGLLKLVDSRILLSTFSLLSMICLTVALLAPAGIAVWAFPMVGFFASLMYGAIFSLALNSVKSHHGSFSGILCTGIMGGAVLPPVVGGLGDIMGLKFGMMFLFIPYLYILSIGFWAKPLIKNATLFNKDQAGNQE